MPLFATLTADMLLRSAAILAVTACVDAWVWMAVRWRRGQPVLPYQARRPVPWGGIDVVAVLVVYIVSAPLVMEAARSWFGLEVPMAAPAAPSPLDIEHPLARVLSERPSVWGVLICAAAAVVIGPLTEELIFRLLLQGWLESLERRMRRQAPLLRRVVAGFAPVTLVAVLFAAMHFRRAEDWDAQTIVCRQGIYLVASVVTVTALICWLRFAAGATLADFGIVPGKIAADVKLGLLALLAVAAPVYAVAFAAKRALPEGVVTDPIPILFLALALGILYYRTHRIVPAIVLHMAFNTIGVILALGAVR